jgi:hypothetical protein
MDDPAMIILSSECWQLLGVVGKYRKKNNVVESISCKETAWFDPKVSEWSNVGSGYWLFDAIEYVLENDIVDGVGSTDKQVYAYLPILDIADKIKKLAKNLALGENMTDEHYEIIQKLNRPKISEMLYGFANDAHNYELVYPPKGHRDYQRKDEKGRQWMYRGLKNKKLKDFTQNQDQQDHPHWPQNNTIDRVSNADGGEGGMGGGMTVCE